MASLKSSEIIYLLETVVVYLLQMEDSGSGMGHPFDWRIATNIQLASSHGNEHCMVG